MNTFLFSKSLIKTPCKLAKRQQGGGSVNSKGAVRHFWTSVAGCLMKTRRRATTNSMQSYLAHSWFAVLLIPQEFPADEKPAYPQLSLFLSQSHPEVAKLYVNRELD